MHIFMLPKELNDKLIPLTVPITVSSALVSPLTTDQDQIWFLSTAQAWLFSPLPCGRLPRAWYLATAISTQQSLWPQRSSMSTGDVYEVQQESPATSSCSSMPTRDRFQYISIQFRILLKCCPGLCKWHWMSLRKILQALCESVSSALI